MLERHISEKRLVDSLTLYWERLRDNVEGTLPPVQQVNSAALGDLWDHCCQLSIHSESNRSLFKYDYIGSEVKKAYGADLTGQFANLGVRVVPGDAILGDIRNCIDNKEPVSKSGNFINDKSRMIKYRSCIIPFGNSALPEKGVSYVIMGLSWRAF